MVDIVGRYSSTYLVGNSTITASVDRYLLAAALAAGGRCVRVPAVKSTPNNIVLADSRIVNSSFTVCFSSVESPNRGMEEKETYLRHRRSKHDVRHDVRSADVDVRCSLLPKYKIDIYSYSTP